MLPDTNGLLNSSDPGTRPFDYPAKRSQPPKPSRRLLGDDIQVSGVVPEEPARRLRVGRAQPTLSIVVASTTPLESFGPLLREIQSRCVHSAVDLVIVRRDETDAVPALRLVCSAARVIAAPARATVAELRSMGMREVQGDIVVVADDSAIDAAWLESLPSTGSIDPTEHPAGDTTAAWRYYPGDTRGMVTEPAGSSAQRPAATPVDRSGGGERRDWSGITRLVRAFRSAPATKEQPG
ncbi:MAG: hypothetical protein ACRENI_14430 [Gemmatimonadaceae bacterium]